MTRVRCGAALCVAVLLATRAGRADGPPFVQDTGTPVEFDADRLYLSVFVAPGAFERPDQLFPDPFVKMGRTPLALKLVPGVYTASVESPEITSGSTIFRVGTEPVHLRIRSGSAGARGLGTLLLAIGVGSALAGLVIEASYSSKPDGISKSKIAIPLFGVAAAGIGSGLVIYLTSGTSIEQEGPKPDRRGAFVGVTSRW
jgi:hypothetical protein